eukprot:comp17278_c0_seq1/m.16382 comp17278_c0_seq1/g.16382  ORF comp17278_c0_seq1/g.16382 comp17278_c0_seq1/m.16382 type:complete len:258 (-) comp17278_c0_seq1:512-1285(-)
MPQCTHGKGFACTVACLAHSLETESRHAAHSKYVQRTQKDGGVSDLQRDAVVSWLLSLNTHMAFSQQTFFLAVNYLDRFLSQVRVQEKHLQLLAAACFLLASKVQEESEEQPTLGELVKAGAYAFSATDLVRMERIVCDKLKWEFSTVTPLNFVVQYVEVAASHNVIPERKVVAILTSAAKHLEQVCLYDFLRYPPSLQALCALLLAIREQLPRAQADKVMRQILSLLEPVVQWRPESDPFRLCMLDMQYVLGEVRC